MDLTNNAPKDVFKALLNLETQNIDNNFKKVQDGNGTDSGLSLSSTGVKADILHIVNVNPKTSEPLNVVSYNLTSEQIESTPSENMPYSMNWQTRTADYSMTSSDRVILVDTSSSSGNITITLPATPADCANVEYIIKKTTTAHAVIIDTAALETIDGDASVSISTQWDVRRLSTDGTNWFIVG